MNFFLGSIDSWIHHLVKIRKPVTETNTVIEVKEQIEKLLGFKTSDQKIFNFHSDEEFEDPKILQKCGIKGDCAMAYKYVKCGASSR